jgi:hypothetical protein
MVVVGTGVAPLPAIVVVACPDPVVVVVDDELWFVPEPLPPVVVVAPLGAPLGLVS